MTRTSNLELWPIGNCQVSGLVDDTGALVWGCVPRVDGDPVFSALLNGEQRDAGIWRFELEGQTKASQRYIRNTPHLLTTLEAEDGSAVEVLDFCPRFERSGRMYRPVAYVRIVRPISGHPRIKVVLKPTKNYGAGIADTTHGTNHIRFLTGATGLRLSTDAPVGYIQEGRTFRIESDTHFFLGPDEPFVGNLREQVRSMEQSTRKYWQNWVRMLAIPLEWQEEVIRCAITLKLCQHEETGAIVAALTLQFPKLLIQSAIGIIVTAGSAIPITPSRRSIALARLTLWKSIWPICATSWTARAVARSSRSIPSWGRASLTRRQPAIWLAIAAWGLSGGQCGLQADPARLLWPDRLAQRAGFFRPAIASPGRRSRFCQP